MSALFQCRFRSVCVFPLVWDHSLDNTFESPQPFCVPHASRVFCTIPSSFYVRRKSSLKYRACHGHCKNEKFPLLFLTKQFPFLAIFFVAKEINLQTHCAWSVQKKILLLLEFHFSTWDTAIALWIRQVTPRCKSMQQFRVSHGTNTGGLPLFFFRQNASQTNPEIAKPQFLARKKCSCPDNLWRQNIVGQNTTWLQRNLSATGLLFCKGTIVISRELLAVTTVT